MLTAFFKKNSAPAAFAQSLYYKTDVYNKSELFSSTTMPSMLALCLLCSCSKGIEAPETLELVVADTVYLFSYFKGNGEDGLHLAYSQDTYHWKALQGSFLKPQLGKEKLMRDPCIIRGIDGLFHMVWTMGWKGKSIGYASSADLVHWSAQKEIPVMVNEPQAKNCWAPEITYDPLKKCYLVYWATTIPGRFPATDKLGDDDHRLYCVTTNDFVQFSETKLFYDRGFNVIDATIQYDGNQYLMFLKDETSTPPQKNIRLAYSEDLGQQFSPASSPITGNYWAEGPTAIKKGANWIVYFDKYTQHKYGAVISSDLQHWTDISDKVSFPPGARHGTVFTVTGDEFRQFFGAK